MANGNKKTDAFRNTYESYTPSSPLPPVPPFPCDLNSLCTADNRLCDRHRSVLFVKVATGETFEIPYGKWESWLWYKQRINDRTGIPLDEIRLIFAGAERKDLSRHSGLQYQSTIHMVQRKPVCSSVATDEKT